MLFRRGAPPDAIYLFKHALVQDTAYGTLLREPRRALHARIADAIEGQFPDIAESEPELLARHCTEAGLIEKAAQFWGKAGLRSLARSALLEAETQLTRALTQIASLSGTPALRREQITLQIGLANALMQTKGYAARETMACLEKAHLLINRAEALGESTEDPLALFSILYGVWVSNLAAFNSDSVRNLAAQFLTLAQQQGRTFPLALGHRLIGGSLLFAGDIAEGRAHLDRAVEFYDPHEHRPLATRFGQDVGVVILSNRAVGLMASRLPWRGPCGHRPCALAAERFSSPNPAIVAFSALMATYRALLFRKREKDGHGPGCCSGARNEAPAA